MELRSCAIAKRASIGATFIALLFLTLLTSTALSNADETNVESYNATIDATDNQDIAPVGEATEIRTPVPGKLSADKFEYLPDGTVIASGNVVFESPNLLPDGKIVVTADKLVYTRADSKIKCSGRVVVDMPDVGAQFSGSELEYDTRAKTGLLTDVSGSVEIDFEPDLDLPPSHLFILDGDMTIESAGNETLIKLHQARISTYPFSDTDMWFQLKEVEFKSGEYIEMKKASVYVEGFRVMYWPDYRYSFVKHPGLFRSGIPTVGFNGDDGLRVFYYPSVYLGPLVTQINLDYWTERGMLTEFDHYVEFGDFTAGVQHGEVWDWDINSDTAIHKKRFNAYIDGERTFEGGIIRKVEARVEYGRFKQELPDLTANRLAAKLDLSFKRKPLGGGSYFAFNTGVRYFKYFDLPTDDGTQESGALLFDDSEGDFVVFTSAAALGRVMRDGTDKIELRFNPNKGTPAFRFDDKLNEFEVAGVKHLKLNKKWMAVGRGLYDLEHNELDSLSFELRRMNKAYTIGIAWDFQTSSAQLTVGARFW